MINKLQLQKILFLDIETTNQCKKYEHLSPKFKAFWQERSALIRARSFKFKTVSDEELYLLKAAIFPEFGKIICISVGYLSKSDDNSYRLKSKSFFDGGEAEIIKSFFELTIHSFNDLGYQFISGHNIREFDLPYICRRALVNEIEIPRILNFAGKRPWQVGNLIDTMELWKFGDYKTYSSLELLCHILGIETPKSEVNGQSVPILYWYGNQLNRIVEYCERDVLATARLLCILTGNRDLIPEKTSTRVK